MFVVWRCNSFHVSHTIVTSFNRITVEYFVHRMSLWGMTVTCFTQICFQVNKKTRVKPYYFASTFFFFNFILSLLSYPVLVVLDYMVRRYYHIHYVLKRLYSHFDKALDTCFITVGEWLKFLLMYKVSSLGFFYGW